MSQLVVRLYVQYLALGRMNIVAYNHLKLMQYVGYAELHCEFSLLHRSVMHQSLVWLYVQYPALGRIHIVAYNQLRLIQQAGYAAVASTVESIAQWRINRSSDCMFNSLHWVEWTLLLIINSHLSNMSATQLLWVQFTPSLSDASIGRLIVCSIPCIGQNKHCCL